MYVAKGFSSVCMYITGAVVILIGDVYYHPNHPRNAGGKRSYSYK